MNLKILYALAWEEWLRVRAWWGWALVALLANIVLLGLLYALWRDVMKQGEETTSDFLILCVGGAATAFPFLLCLVLTALTATYTRADGLSLTLPTRHSTLPVHVGLVLLIQLICRLLFIAPFFLIWGLAFASWEAYESRNLVDDRGIAPAIIEAWLSLPFIAVAGACAAAAFAQKLGSLAYAVWVVFPGMLWFLALSQMQENDFLWLFPCSLALPFFGVVLGAIRLRHGGALEPFHLPLRWQPRAHAHRGDAQPLSSPGAAIRWAESPGGVWWPTAAALGLGGIIAGYQMLTIARYMMMGSIWLPWTPRWVMAASIAQAFFVRFFTMAFSVLLVAAAPILALQGFVFLRRNYLRRPFAARLPVSNWDFTLHATLVLLRHAFLAAALGLLVCIGGHLAFSTPNIGLSFGWASWGPDGAFYDVGVDAFSSGGMHLTRQWFWADVGTDSTVAYFAFVIPQFVKLIGLYGGVNWGELSPVTWLLGGAAALGPADLIFLAITFGVAAWICGQDRRRIAAGIFAALCIIAIVGAIGWPYLPVGMMPELSDSLPEPKTWPQYLRAISASLALLMLPPASLWAVLRLRRYE